MGTIEDISISCSIPNMSVITPCDPEEVKVLTKWCCSISISPVYFRLGKAGESILTNKAEKFNLGKIRYIKKGDNTCILSCGTILRKSLYIHDIFLKQKK